MSEWRVLGANNEKVVGVLEMILKLCIFVWVLSVTGGFFSSMGLLAYFIMKGVDK